MDPSQFISLGAGGLVVAGIGWILLIVQKSREAEAKLAAQERKDWLGAILEHKKTSEERILRMVEGLQDVANLLRERSLKQ